MIEEAGMEFVAVYDAFTQEPPREESEQGVFYSQRKRKGGTNPEWKITLLEELLRTIRFDSLQLIQE